MSKASENLLATKLPCYHLTDFEILKNKNVILEIGFGDGNFLLNLIKSNIDSVPFPKLNQTSNFRAKTKECTCQYMYLPATREITKDHLRMGIGIIGAEVYEPGIASLLRGLKKIDAPKENIKIWPEDANKLIEKLPDSSIDQVYILFPDPWPKKKHHRRRIINLALIGELKRIMKPEGSGLFATDHAGYALWIKELLDNQFEHGEWIYSHDFPQGWTETKYQQKALAGELVHFFEIFNFK